MGKKILVLLWISFLGVSAYGQQGQKPKVVIGIVIDQMRADYLTVFNKHYGDNGFNLLKEKGAWFTNCYINYLPAHTGPGHACIYTGSVPSLHGIVGNNWFDKKINNTKYCVTDSSIRAIGGAEISGRISPRNLKVTTMTDELRLATNNRSRTIAISLKDRGAVLPGGHTANAAYWMDGNAQFMSSSFYVNNLPTWASEFNSKKHARKLLNQGWSTLYPTENYLYGQHDNNPDYEGGFADKKTTHFPYTFKSTSDAYIKRTPYGNTILFDFAKKAMINEQIGKKGETDFMALSFSATDYVGHVFGPNSLEVEDTYARFDNDLADFIDFLNAEYGNGNYLMFLTADHGAAHNPNYLKDKNVPAGYFFEQKEQLALNEHLENKFGVKDLCVKLMNCQVYFDKKVTSYVQSHMVGSFYENVKKATIDYFNEHQLVQMAFESDNIEELTMPSFVKEYYHNSYFQGRSGDISLLFYPAVLDAYSTTGTSHGAWSAYDTHIPLVFYGAGVPKGKHNQKVFMTDIAPTITNMLGITAPNGSIGNVIIE